MINDSYSIQAIGVIRTPFGSKFAVPRQPGLAPSCKSYIEFFPPYNDELAFVGLDGFTHIHILFLFDKIPDQDKFKAQVRPPRLGGNKKAGVFATRSPFRPSRIGLSVVSIDKIERINGKVRLHVLGADLVDKTPIIDIKPYIPFVDSIKDAKGGYASEKPEQKEVILDNSLLENLTLQDDDIKAIKEILSQDPRPAYKGDIDDDKEYDALLCNHHICFRVSSDKVIITKIIEEKELL